MLAAFAPAKINLFLYVTGRRDDGYHTLESLVTFADVGDRLTLDLAKPFSLNTSGPYAEACGKGADNLVIKAALALQSRMSSLKTGAFHLEKHLPVAAGIGGGSADAAAALRLLMQANTLPLDDEAVIAAALETGADVPICLSSEPALMRGIGDIIEPARLPALHLVLVNCGLLLSARDVFTEFVFEDRKQAAPVSPPQDLDAMIAWLGKSRNDLTKAAYTLCPELADVDATVKKTGAALVRMSGSGPTMFGIYRNEEEAAAAAVELVKIEPGWWVKAVKAS